MLAVIRINRVIAAELRPLMYVACNYLHSPVSTLGKYLDQKDDVYQTNCLKKLFFLL